MLYLWTHLPDLILSDIELQTYTTRESSQANFYNYNQHDMEYDNDLPDIPYTPLQEETGKQQAMEPPPPKRSRALTPAERKARSRSKQSAEKKEQAKEKDRQCQANKRADDSEEKREQAKEKQRQAKAKNREDETEAKMDQS